MTLPPSLSDLYPESESEHELSRLTLVVGDLRIDVGLPADVGIGEYIDEVIDIANEQISVRNAAASRRFDASDNGWTLAPLGGDPIDPHRSLRESGVYDGDLVMVGNVERPVTPLLFDDVDNTASPEATPVRDQMLRNAPGVTCFAVAIAATTTLGVQLHRWAGDPLVPYAVLALGVVGMALAAALALRPSLTGRFDWVFAAALPLVFSGSLYVVPDGFGATSLPMAFAAVALSSLVVLLISRSGRTLHTAVITMSAFGGVAATAMLLTRPPVRTVGVLVAMTAVLVVYLAPRVTIAVSKLPVPRVPTAGEPLDEIETQGGTTVEGVNAIGKQIIPTEENLNRRVRRANQYLTGLLVGAAIAAAIGSYLADDVSNGFFWQGTVFAIAVATVLGLRGRGHHDLAQAAVLIGSGMALAIAVIVKTAVYVADRQILAMVALAVLTVLIIACGLVAPRREFSPVIRRRVEVLEYIAIASMFPLCFWIVRLYAFFRELRI